MKNDSKTGNIYLQGHEISDLALFHAFEKFQRVVLRTIFRARGGKSATLVLAGIGFISYKKFRRFQSKWNKNGEWAHLLRYIV